MAASPRLYLVTPQLTGDDECRQAAAALAKLAAANDVGSVLLRVDDNVDDNALRRMVDTIRAAVPARDIAVLIEQRAEAARPAGADGLHLRAGTDYAQARRLIGPDLAIGVSCSSRDEAMTLADAGADYICFGAFDDSAPSEETLELVAWWSPLITVPCVAAPGPADEGRRALADAGADFVAVTLDFPSR